MKLSLKNLFIGTVVFASLYEQVEGILFLKGLRTKSGGGNTCDFDPNDAERIIEGFTGDAIRDLERAKDQAIADIRYELQIQFNGNGPYGSYNH